MINILNFFEKKYLNIKYTNMIANCLTHPNQKDILNHISIFYYFNRIFNIKGILIYQSLEPDLRDIIYIRL